MSSAKSVEKSQVQKLSSLTGLRFFAAILVVFYHFTGAVYRFVPLAVRPILGDGFRMVSLFYVLSGFILVWNYRSSSGAMKGTSGDFWRARLARIYPAYFLSFLLAAPAVFAYAKSAYDIHSIWKVPVGGGAFLLMVQAWSSRLEAFWNFPGWSVSVEAFFYAVFPMLLAFLGRWQKRRCLIGIGLCWAASLALLLAGHALRLDADEFPLLRLPEFVMGMLGALVASGFRSQRFISYLAAPTAVILCVLALSSDNMLPGLLRHGGTLGPVFLLLILSLVYDRSFVSRFLGSKPLTVLGEASYGIYILQWPVFFLMGLDTKTITQAGLAVYVIVLCTVAILSEHFVERPLRRVIRTFRVASKMTPQEAGRCWVATDR